VYWALSSESDSVVIVEGPADAESLRQLGQSAIALCGLNELPPDELIRLRRRETIYLSVDHDQAAQDKLKALDSSVVRMLNALGPLTLIVPKADYKDVNAWLQHGLTVDILRDYLSKSDTWLEKRSRQFLKITDPSQVEPRMNEIGQLLSHLPMAAQLHYTRIAAKSLGIGIPEVRRLITQAQANHNGNGQRLSEIRQGKICFLGETLANFAPTITHELILDDGENPPVCHYTLTGALETGQPLEQIEISAEEFPAMSWVGKHWGARAIIHIPRGRYNVLARATQEVSLESLQRERVYQYTGWSQIGGQRAFLSASGALYADKLDTSVRVDLGGNNLRHYALPAPVDGTPLAAAVNASIGFLCLADRKVTAPLWAAMFAAPLTAARSLNAVMWVYGPTQSGKSTITHLALSHYGAGFISGREYHAPMDWTSTTTAIEGALFRAKDSVLVIDDFAPQFTSKAEAMAMHKKAHLVARSVGNRSSRGRARADLSEQVTRVPRGLCIATAENPLVGQSIVGRMIYVTVEHGQLIQRNGQALDAAQRAGQSGAYAQAMTAYIQWLAENWERAVSLYQQSVEESAVFARTNSQLQNRLPDYYGVLDAASQVALQAFHEMGYLSSHELQKLTIENSEALLTVIAGQAEKIALESPVRKFLEALTSLQARSRVYLAPRTNKVEYRPPDRAELVGWYEPFDSSVIYLDPDVCLQHAKAYWKDLDENLDILPDALTRQMAQAGLLRERGTDSRLKVSKYVQGKPRWVLSIDTARVQQVYGIDLSNEKPGSVDDNEDLPL